jgi:hypothetical protein
MRIENRGVAPFYHDWPGEFGLLAEDGTVLRTAAAQGRLTGLLPGDPPRVWTGRIDLTGQRPARRVLAVRVPNPLPHGRPLRFANETQDRHAPGWLTLLTFAAEAPPVVAPRQPPPARSSAR